MLLQLDEMIEREHAEGEPHRRRREGAHFEQRQRDDAAGEADLEIDRVIGRQFDVTIDVFAYVHDVFGGVGMLGEKFGLFLDLLGDVVEFCGRRTRRRAMVLLAVAPQMIMEIVVPPRVVKQDDAASDRVDLATFHPHDAGELFADLVQQLWISLRRTEFHPDAA